MALKSVLKPPESVVVGLANAAVVVAIYQGSLPNTADLRSAKAHDATAESARKAAAWKSAGMLGLVFLLTRDINSALIGGAVLAAYDYHVKHANGTNPATGKLDAGGAITSSAAGDNATAYPLPDYPAGTEADQ